jgi:predicted RNA binding protein YcfA (HicA-like mRNA interferase family)
VPLRPLRYEDVCRKLARAGFADYAQSGSHVKFVKKVKGGYLTAIVPKHREVTVGTQRSIIRQAALTVEQWQRL